MDIASDWTQQLYATGAIAIAAILGAAIGAERELLNRPAGLRTHALLAAAAALLVEISRPLVMHLDSPALEGALRADPLRMAEAIVTGVAFIGAGTIFRHRADDIVEGLTTAASLLLVAAVAITVAVGEIVLAVLVTLLSLAVLHVVRRFTHGRGNQGHGGP